MALLKDGTRIYGTLYANTEVVIGSMNVASQINASFLQANSANILAQAAFNAANTATSNTVYTKGVDDTQNTNISTVNTFAGSAYNKANSANVIAQSAYDKANSANVIAQAAFDRANTDNTLGQAAFDKANSANVLAQAAFDKANTDNTLGQAAFDAANTAIANTVYTQGINNTQNTNITSVTIFASSSYDKANSANVLAQSAYDTANTKLNITGGTVTGDISFTGANVALGNVANVHLYGGNTGQLLVTDGAGNISFIDLPTPNTVTYTANSLIQTNGVYVSGNLWSTQVFGDYGSANGAYVLTDGSGSAPAWYIDFDFINVVKFNRVVMNINYSQNSGHTIYVQLYNNVTLAWDNIGTYTGLGSYYAFALEVIDETAYVNAGQVQLRLYHSNQGNVSHQTSIDYIALEQSYQGPQGPRGPTGSTGATGATGNGVSSGGTTGQVLIKNSSTNYDTSWSNNLIDAWNTANSASSNTIYTQGINDTQNTNISLISTYATSAYDKANSANALAQAAFDVANNAASGSVDQYARDKANSANVLAQAAFDKANTSVSTSTDQYARDTANTAAANTVYIYGVDNTQNTNISAVNTFAGSAYNKANSANVLAQAAFDKANTGITYDQYARDTANSAAANTIYTKGVDDTQNTNISTVNTYATSAYGKANSANVLAQAAFDKANTAAAGSTDQYARDTANTSASNTVIIQGVDLAQNSAISIIQGVDLAQNSAITIIQSVDLTQNAAISTIQGVDNTQNNNITAINTYATSAYGHANSAFNQANVGATFVNTGGTVSGNVTITKNLSVTGNLYILGNTTTINTSSFTVQDSLIVLGVGNYATDLLDIGFAGHYNNGTNAHAGLVRDASVKEFYIFDGYTPELDANNNIDINDASFNKANLNAGVFKGNLIGSTAIVNGLELYNYSTSAYAKANTVGTLAQASFDVANSASANTVYTKGVDDTQNTNITNVNTFAGSAYDKANTADVKAQAAFDKANTGISSSTDQFARDTANTASANTIYLSGVNTTQNSNISFLSVYTQAAFDKANTGGSSSTDQYARDTANSKTYTFYQNTAPSTSNAHDLWVNSNTGIVYENFGNTTTPIWAEFGPTAVSNTSNVYINTLDRLSNLTSSLVLNNDGSLRFNNGTLQTTAYTGFGIDNVARTTANSALANTGGTVTGNLVVTGSMTLGGKTLVVGPAFSAYADSGVTQTITSGSQQKVLFQLEEFDTDGTFSSSKFTPNVEGYYQLNATVKFDGNLTTGEILIAIYKNGSEYKRAFNTLSGGTTWGSSGWQMSVNTLVYANGTTDNFEVYVQQTSGNSRNIGVSDPKFTYFNGAMMRGA
jgi:hypothetical protein